MAVTLYWHDYETFGIDPARDRPVQFAGIRTNEDLEEVGEPLMIYCRPPSDYLPSPDACMVTGITPQLALEKGMPEAKFIERIHDELSRPKTCTVGYNSLRFDDEVTRNTLNRNLFDPYAREWQGGNSRWDLIDMVRACRALRPEGIHWPDREDGRPSFRLEDLTVANGIAHAEAHDALADVRATIAMARLVKQAQPRLYDYLFKLRDKRKASELLNVINHQPVVHCSGMYGPNRLNTAIVYPLINHPTNNNGVLVYDLHHAPAPFLEMDVETLRERLFTSQAELGDDVQRVPVKTVHVNKCPVLAPIKTLDAAAQERTHTDVNQCLANAKVLNAYPAFAQRIREAFGAQQFEEKKDPDLTLYGGGFFSQNDRKQMERIRQLQPEQLSGAHFPFDDTRLPEMLFRYRARNWPETLNEEEAGHWQEHREYRLMEGGEAVLMNLEAYHERIDALRGEHAQGDKAAVLDALEEYGHMIVDM